MPNSSLALNTLPGLEATHHAKLAELGITTTLQLYRLGQTPARRQTLANRMQVPLRYVNKWVILADLARIPSVGCQFNGLLLHVGVISPHQLANSSMSSLYPKIRRLHTQTLGNSKLCPSQDMVLSWIQEAKRLPAQA